MIDGQETSAADDFEHRVLSAISGWEDFRVILAFGFAPPECDAYPFKGDREAFNRAVLADVRTWNAAKLAQFDLALETDPPNPSLDRKIAWAFGGVFVALILIGVLYNIITGTTSGDGDYVYDGTAKDQCEDFAKDRLKSPSSAEFSDAEATNDGSNWTVTGTVDSENSYGAMMRGTYTCEMSELGDTWYLDDFDLSQ